MITESPEVSGIGVSHHDTCGYIDIRECGANDFGEKSEDWTVGRGHRSRFDTVHDLKLEIGMDG